MNQSLNIKSFGCVPNGPDNVVALRYCAQVAKAQGQPITVPAGEWSYSDIITLDGVQMIGEGDASVLRSINPERAAIVLTGNDAGLRGLRLTGPVPSVRLSNLEAHRVVARKASMFSIDDLLIDSSAASSIFVYQSVNGSVLRNRVIGQSVDPAFTSLRADGIHITGQSSGISVHKNYVRRTSDDCIACVSYQGDGGMTTNLIIQDNDVGDTNWGRGISVVGGDTVLIENNILYNVRAAAGFYFVQEDSYKTYGAHKVIAINNTLHNCGDPAKGHYAVLVYSSTFEHCSDITLTRNLIVQDIVNGGINIRDNVDRVLLDQNVIIASPPMKLSIAPAPTVKAYADGPVGVHS